MVVCRDEKIMTMRCIAPLAGLFLAGCATATIEDAVPAGALSQTAAQTETEASPPQAGPIADAAPTAGTYPNLNVAPAAAAPQISEQEKTAETADLRAKRAALARRDGATDAAGGERELRDLATGHGDAVLKEIEGR